MDGGIDGKGLRGAKSESSGTKRENTSGEHTNGNEFKPKRTMGVERRGVEDDLDKVTRSASREGRLLGVMAGVESMMPEKSMCKEHRIKEVTEEGIESLLLSDVMGVIGVEAPVSEVGRIIWFFECGEGGASGFVRIEGMRKKQGLKAKGERRGRSKGKKEECVSEGRRRDEECAGHKDQEGACSDANDSRYRYFLHRVFPMHQKDDEQAMKYAVDQRTMLMKRAKVNAAEIPEVRKAERMNGKKDRHMGMKVIDRIPAICRVAWRDGEEKAVEKAVLRYRSDFKKIHENVPGIDIGRCVLKYYLMKNKTHAYMKHKPGRMSDHEIKLVVEDEWTEYEREVFAEHIKVYGRNWGRYQEVINKSEKDLKMFFRYYMKFVMADKKEEMDKAVVKAKKPAEKNGMMKRWSIDERQLFAIYFPYYSRNWILMATYFPQKTPGDLKQYYSRYFKGLSYNEQRLEASLYDFGRQMTTPPAMLCRRRATEEEFCDSAGILFRR